VRFVQEPGPDLSYPTAAYENGAFRLPVSGSLLTMVDCAQAAFQAAVRPPVAPFLPFSPP